MKWKLRQFFYADGKSKWLMSRVFGTFVEFRDGKRTFVMEVEQ